MAEPTTRYPSGPILHVQTLAQRNALSTADAAGHYPIIDGQLCYVRDTGLHYRWDGPGITWETFGEGGAGSAGAVTSVTFGGNLA